MARQSNYNLFQNTVLSGNASIISDKIPIDLSNGYFAVNGIVSGSNVNIKLEYLIGDDDNFTIATTPIVQNLTMSNFQIQFYPDLSKYIKIKATNNSSSQATISLNLIFSE